MLRRVFYQLRITRISDMINYWLATHIFIFAGYPISSPETNLFAAVILQQLQDACPGVKSPRKGKYVLPAREWLLGYSSGFKMICWAAGIDPEAMRDKMRHIAASGWQSPVADYSSRVYGYGAKHKTTPLTRKKPKHV